MMNETIEEAEQPLLTPEEVAANLAARNSEVTRVDMEVEENLNVDLNPTERVETSPVEGVETNIDAPERREIVIVTDEEEEAEKVPPGGETTEVKVAAVPTYQRRPAREEASKKRSEEERLREDPGQSTGGYVESPARSAGGVPVRRRRLIMDEETEEEEDVFFTQLEELSSQRQPDAPAGAADSEKGRRERKRRRKTIATPAKKKPRQASMTLVIQERRPNEVRQEEVEPDKDEALRFERRSKRRYDEVRSTSERRPEVARVQFEKIHISLDNQLLRWMTRFRDPKMDDECDGIIGTNKKARSGKQLHQPSLQIIRGEEEFLEYITWIGFEWLLDLQMPRIPVELAKEFFTSFRFKTTTDLEEESISFRMFTREMRMSIREWSVRLGLYTADQEGEWFGRDIGQPKESPEFNQQAAWKLLVPENTAEFQPTLSRADCIKYPSST